MDHTDLDLFFTRQLEAGRHPVVSIELSAPSPILRDAVLAGVSRLAESHTARHENGAVNLSRGPVAGLQVVAVGRHSVAEIKAAVRSATALRAGVVVIDDLTEPELTRFLDHFVDTPLFT